jgi:hypothetical protein
MFQPNPHNSQQHKPLRSFLNVFNPTPNSCHTIILLELLLEVNSDGYVAITISGVMASSNQQAYEHHLSHQSVQSKNR